MKTKKFKHINQNLFKNNFTKHKQCKNTHTKKTQINTQNKRDREQNQ